MQPVRKKKGGGVPCTVGFHMGYKSTLAAVIIIAQILKGRIQETLSRRRERFDKRTSPFPPAAPSRPRLPPRPILSHALGIAYPGIVSTTPRNYPAR